MEGSCHVLVEQSPLHLALLYCLLILALQGRKLVQDKHPPPDCEDIHKRQIYGELPFSAVCIHEPSLNPDMYSSIQGFVGSGGCWLRQPQGSFKSLPVACECGLNYLPRSGWWRFSAHRPHPGCALLVPGWLLFLSRVPPCCASAASQPCAPAAAKPPLQGCWVFHVSNGQEIYIASALRKSLDKRQGGMKMAGRNCPQCRSQHI